MTGSFAVHDGVAFVPAASWEETRALDPAYPCCTFRGSVTAVRVSDGSVVWKTYLVDAPQRTGQTAAGTPTFGPSGAGVWSTPTVDERARPALRHDRRQLLAPGDGDERCRRRARARDRPHRVVAADHAERRLQLLVRQPRRELSRGRRPRPRLRLLGDVGAHAERRRRPRRRPEIRRRVRVRSGQRRQTAVADPRRQRRNERRRPMGHRERRPQRVRVRLGRRALAERRAARHRSAPRSSTPSKAAASRRSTSPTATASGSRRARRARRRARAAAPRNRPR